MIPLTHGIVDSKKRKVVIPSSPYPLSGLISRYTFDSTLDDSGPDSLNLSIFAGSEDYVDGVTGPSIKAIDLESNSFSASLGTSTAFHGTNSSSICFWGHCHGSNGSGMKIVILQETVASPAIPNLAWGIDYDASPDVFRIARRNSSNQGGFANTTGGPVASWHHFIMTYDGSEILLWKDNGVLAIDYTPTQDLGSDIDTLMINNQSASYTDLWMQNLYLYDRVLTSNERAQLYNSGVPV